MTYPAYHGASIAHPARRISVGPDVARSSIRDTDAGFVVARPVPYLQVLVLLLCRSEKGQSQILILTEFMQLRTGLRLRLDSSHHS